MRVALKTGDRDGRLVGRFEGPWIEELMRERNPGPELATTGWAGDVERETAFPVPL